MWSELGQPWQVCLEQAWEAYCEDCLPIGAAVTDCEGTIRARGRNRVRPRSQWFENARGVETAHAEVEALRSLDYAGLDQHRCTLYTTTEPCPMCMGAFYMSGLRTLCYAARDPFAGSVNMLGKTWYLSRKAIKVKGPDPWLEPLVVGLFVEQELRFHQGSLPEGLFWQMYEQAIPTGVQMGRRMYEGEDLERMRTDHAPVAQVLELFSSWQVAP